MNTLLKHLSGISSAAEMGNELQVPEELPGDKKVDDCDCTDLSINASNYTQPNLPGKLLDLLLSDTASESRFNSVALLAV